MGSVVVEPQTVSAGCVYSYGERREILAKKAQSDWEASDIVALVEISDTTLRRDSGPKLRAYTEVA